MGPPALLLLADPETAVPPTSQASPEIGPRRVARRLSRAYFCPAVSDGPTRPHRLRFEGSRVLRSSDRAIRRTAQARMRDAVRGQAFHRPEWWLTPRR